MDPPQAKYRSKTGEQRNTQKLRFPLLGDILLSNSRLILIKRCWECTVQAADAALSHIIRMRPCDHLQPLERKNAAGE
jgi:hypothetical protein